MASGRSSVWAQPSPSSLSAQPYRSLFPYALQHWLLRETWTGGAGNLGVLGHRGSHRQGKSLHRHGRKHSSSPPLYSQQHIDACVDVLLPCPRRFRTITTRRCMVSSRGVSAVVGSSLLSDTHSEYAHDACGRMRTWEDVDGRVWTCEDRWCDHDVCGRRQDSGAGPRTQQGTQNARDRYVQERPALPWSCTHIAASHSTPMASLNQCRAAVCWTASVWPLFVCSQAWAATHTRAGA